MYDRLIEALKHCLRPKRSGSGGDTNANNQKAYAVGENAELDNVDIQLIAEYIRPHYKKGQRHPIVFGLSGLLHKSGISKDSAIALVETLAKNDNESDVRNAVQYRRGDICERCENCSWEQVYVAGPNGCNTGFWHCKDHTR